MSENPFVSCKIRKRYIALIVIVVEIIILIYFEMTKRMYDTDHMYGKDMAGVLRHMSSGKDVCEMESLSRFWNSNITTQVHQDISCRHCHTIEVDLSSLRPVRDWNGTNIPSYSNTSDTRIVFITVNDTACCLYRNQTERGLAQIMNKQNFEGVTCHDKNASFNTDNMHHTALVSYPGSGNTWVRHLLEYISGIFTGSVYFDYDLKKEFQAERYTERVLVIKTHEMHDKHPNMKYDDVILLIRDPLESLLSMYNFVKSASHTKTADLATFNSSDWHRHVAHGSNAWKGLYFSWLREYRGRKMVLSYLKLQQDFFNEVFRVSQFLNLTITYKTLWCAYVNQEGRFRRTPYGGINKYTVFNNTALEKIKSVRTDVDQKIEEMFGIVKLF